MVGHPFLETILPQKRWQRPRWCLPASITDAHTHTHTMTNTTSSSASLGSLDQQHTSSAVCFVSQKPLSSARSVLLLSVQELLLGPKFFKSSLWPAELRISLSYLSSIPSLKPGLERMADVHLTNLWINNERESLAPCFYSLSLPPQMARSWGGGASSYQRDS